MYSDVMCALPGRAAASIAGGRESCVVPRIETDDAAEDEVKEGVTVTMTVTFCPFSFVDTDADSVGVGVGCALAGALVPGP